MQRRRKMPKYETMYAHGYWNDTKESLNYMVITNDSWDGIEDAEDEGIFYYLDGVPEIGDHGDFTITEVENG
jgi:hypothetical protein